MCSSLRPLRSFGILCSNVDSFFPARCYLLFSPLIASLIRSITRRLTRSERRRHWIHETSFAHDAVASDFVRIGYLSIGRSLGDRLTVKICHNVTAMRRDGGGACGCHTYAMHHCQRGWEFKARKEKRGERERERERERGAKWHQNPQLDTACALPVQARQVHLKVSRSGGHGMHIVSESSSG